MANTILFSLTLFAEKVLAKDLPAMAQDLAQQGLRVYIRPRGAFGALKGNIEVLSARVNPEPAVLTTAKGSRKYLKGQTLAIVSNRSDYPGNLYFPLKYGVRKYDVSFRVFVR